MKQKEFFAYANHPDYIIFAIVGYSLSGAPSYFLQLWSDEGDWLGELRTQSGCIRNFRSADTLIELCTNLCGKLPRFSYAP